MDANLEALILSGEFFNGAERSSSPARSATSSRSPSPGWHDEELSTASDSYSNRVGEKPAAPVVAPMESIGMGPGRTGVKGVIRDRDEAVEREKERKEKEMEDLRGRMQQVGGKTFLEEEREKVDGKVDVIVEKEREKDAEAARIDLYGRKKEGRFGHLREVGVKGFVPAVEEEETGVWVVVHLYDPSLERCYLIDETLARLARLYPGTKFIRSRASTLGFASNAPKSTAPASNFLSASRPRRGQEDEDEDDPYTDEKDDSEDEDQEDDDVDLDMLPTMLVYRDGGLVHNWVRVDWEAGPAGIEDLLDRYHILPRDHSLGSSQNLGLPSDGEDDFDLLWSDEEDAAGR